MLLLPVHDASIEQAAAILRGGGIAAFPTETVYGLGADAFNAAAVARVFEVKGRPRFDPLIVHIASLAGLEHVADISALEPAARERLRLLSEQLWPGPLTLVLPRRDTVPGIVSAGLPTVAVRIPAHDAARRLIDKSGGAVAAPSANPFGYISPTRASHVHDMLGEKVDIILDGGPAAVGVESTVLDICRRQPRILRPGGIPTETIEEVIGPVALNVGINPGTGGGLISPGQLKSHYAPHTPLSVFDRDTVAALPGIEGTAIIFFDGSTRDAWLGKHRSGANSPAEIRTLSETGNPLEAASRLFEILHELDRAAIGALYAQLAPESGLGAAINDRLRRAGA